MSQSTFYYHNNPEFLRDPVEALLRHRNEILQAAEENIRPHAAIPVETSSNVYDFQVHRDARKTYSRQVANNIMPTNQAAISPETQATITDLNEIRALKAAEAAYEGMTYPIPSEGFEDYAEKVA